MTFSRAGATKALPHTKLPVQVVEQSHKNPR